MNGDHVSCTVGDIADSPDQSTLLREYSSTAPLASISTPAASSQARRIPHPADRQHDLVARMRSPPATLPPGGHPAPASAWPVWQITRIPLVSMARAVAAQTTKRPRISCPIRGIVSTPRPWKMLANSTAMKPPPPIDGARQILQNALLEPMQLIAWQRHGGWARPVAIRIRSAVNCLPSRAERYARLPPACCSKRVAPAFSSPCRYSPRGARSRGPCWR